MTTYSSNPDFNQINGNYISGEITVGAPYAAITPILESLDATRTKAEEVLVLLIGEDGGGGLLGQMMAGLEDAPSVAINPNTVDTDVNFEASGLPVPTFDETTLRVFPEDTYPVPTFNESSLKDFSDDTYPVPTFNESSLKEFSEAQYPVPTFDESSLQSFPDDTYSAPTMASLPTVDAYLEAVEEPESPILTLTWAEAVLPSELFTAFKTKILADLSGGTGLSPEVEAAIYTRAKTRQQVDRLAEYDRINNAAGDMQFAYPSGVLLSALAGFGVGANRMDADIENTIIVAQGELAQKNVLNAMEQAKALEGLLRQTRSEESQRALETMKSVAELAIQNFSAQVQKFIGIWEGRKVKVQAQVESLRGVIESNRALIDIFSKQYDVFRTRIDAVASHNKGVVDVFTGRMQAYGEAERAVSSHNKTLVDVFTGRMQAYGEAERAVSSHNKTMVDVFAGRTQAFGESERAISSFNKGLIDVFAGRTQAYGEVERAISTRNDSNLKLLAEKMRNADLDLRAQIAESEALIQAYTAEQSIRERIVGGVSNIAAQVSASLLSAVHTSLGASYNATESADKSYRVSVGISESHEVPHDPAG